jgi:arylsulfatase A-like enzyme
MYGAEPGKESFANNCLLARRLAQQGVRFIQLYDWGWDSHGAGKNEALNEGFKDKCKQVDQPTAALLSDLKANGMLDDTLVIWSGEFGRTPMRENRGGTEMAFIGRDHNPSAFTLWMAGGGVKKGISYGESDEVGYNAAVNPVHLRDFHATLLHLLGMDHQHLVYPFQGLDQKLTGVKPAQVVEGILA